jgi:hypothetical protein
VRLVGVTNDDSRDLVLRRYLSPERLAPYVVAAGGLNAAEELYGWNLAVSGAFYEVLGAFEVTLRNALHAQLTEWHGERDGAWYRDPRRVLSEKSREDVQAARERVRRLSQPETPGRVVAELGFGFWRFLLASQYERTLWTPHLRHAFPHLRPQSRREVHDRVARLNQLRNRVAHHEPIHSRDLARDHADLLVVAGWTHPTVAQWITGLSRVPIVLASRPVGGA